VEGAEDLWEKIRDVVGGSGEVLEEYGGYAIWIVSGDRFPWSRVCRLLLNIGHEVWIEKRGETFTSSLSLSRTEHEG